ncbi:MAG: carboxypeptidase-like regulatory domain-containing protein, partial [Myxococcota bacterium]
MSRALRFALGLALALALLGVTPARAAVIQGHVTHPTKPGAAAGLVVTAIGIDEKENTIQRETRTDANGSYRFADLPSPAAYLVRARYGEMVFPGGSAVFRPGEPTFEQTVDLKIYETSSDGSRLRLASLQWVIARNAGEWRVQQNAVIANPDATVVMVPPDAAPLLRIALAPKHGEVETAFGRLPEGVVIQNGVAEIRGPILPGDQGASFQIGYDVEAPDTELATVLALPSAVDELGVYLQDFGIDVDAGPLHPARPVRESDIIYQAFLGFELHAGTEVPLRVRALPPAAQIPQWLIGGIAALLAGGLLFLVAGRLVFGRRRLGVEPATPED